VIRNGTTLTGEGTMIAIIDTGMYYPHKDLEGRIVGCQDFINNREAPYGFYYTT
jgi:serine protease AprX